MPVFWLAEERGEKYGFGPQQYKDFTMYQAVDSMLVYQFALHHCNLLHLLYFSDPDLAVPFSQSSINSYKSMANTNISQLKHAIACSLNLIQVHCPHPRCRWVAFPLGPTYPSNCNCHAFTVATSSPKLKTKWAPDVNRRFLPFSVIDNLLGWSPVSTH
jgi:hypothetical protein